MSHLVTCECGYSKRSKTQALAEYGLRAHSCERHRRLTERRARGDVIRAHWEASRAPKPCAHNGRHQHGTYACYVLDRCRCRPCTDANTVYERRRTRNNAYGRPPYVDAAPAREHVNELRRAGLGLKRIAAISGVPHGSLAKLMYGDRQRRLAPSKRIRPETESRILAVEADPRLLGAKIGIDSTGSHRRVQALVWLGWSQSSIAHRLGMESGNFWAAMHSPTIGAGLACRIRDLYDELQRTRPPEDTRQQRGGVTRARNMARANGWKPPMWWGDDIDDPFAGLYDTPVEADVDEIAVERYANGDTDVRLNRDEKWAAYCLLRRRGETHNAAIVRIGVSGQYASDYRDRYAEAAAC